LVTNDYSSGPFFRATPALKRRNLKALVTTDTELKAIAAPATTGFKKPSAATVMPTVL